ncbi:methyltransferase [Paeniglutamicibacter psychrophenolicus]|uniref:16S rRNA (Guanine1207-N2)-methyltransferase n=1 Tax=Paeniglutamicibacter psychrophenolicus TaxID=257454 RepID=A0ABS4WG01_9MICC|nr:class I SAM-dependent methyltransferase [Paeniglutamicibacter psychrophenolicus]MBP2375140.1 16S rRNA (guanine1207-N2)-methyltransferase [Paeniglutamicibacter psychrophenolicus]
MSLDFSLLSRWPDVEDENLHAVDAADRLLLDLASEAGWPAEPGRVVILGDHYGALVLGALDAGVRGIRVHQDALSGARAIDANAASLMPGLSGEYRQLPPGAELLRGATLVLMALPRSLDALEEMLGFIAEHAEPFVTVMAAGRIKHMNLSMNQVLGSYFGSVTASLGRQKSRVLTATGLLPAGQLPATRFPLQQSFPLGLAKPLELRAYAQTFGGAKLDPGTRFLLEHLEPPAGARRAVDLGCGNGTIGTYLAVKHPRLSVHACDQSASAVASTQSTAAANGVGDRVLAVQDDALGTLPAASEQLVVLNPPFHMGNTVHAGIALKLIADAGRVLAPGGELWCVWNSHLGYRSQLEKLVGSTRQVARNPKFTVTVSTKA